MVLTQTEEGSFAATAQSVHHLSTSPSSMFLFIQKIQLSLKIVFLTKVNPPQDKGNDYWVLFQHEQGARRASFGNGVGLLSRHTQ
jgi:hypothetical protein